MLLKSPWLSPVFESLSTDEHCITSDSIGADTLLSAKFRMIENHYEKNQNQTR